VRTLAGLRAGRGRRYGALGHRRHRSAASGATRRVHILVKPTRSDLDHESRHKHRPAHLSPRTARHGRRPIWRRSRGPIRRTSLIALQGRQNAEASAVQRRSADRSRHRRAQLPLCGSTATTRGVEAACAPSTTADRCSSSFRPGSRTGRDAAAVRGWRRAAAASWSITVSKGRYMVVDRLFGAAELRMGDKTSAAEACASCAPMARAGAGHERQPSRNRPHVQHRQRPPLRLRPNP
jgi:hypothetical protein